MEPKIKEGRAWLRFVKAVISGVLRQEFIEALIWADPGHHLAPLIELPAGDEHMAPRAWAKLSRMFSTNPR